MDPRLFKLVPRAMAGDPIAIAILGVGALAYLGKSIAEKADK